MHPGRVSEVVGLVKASHLGRFEAQERRLRFVSRGRLILARGERGPWGPALRRRRLAHERIVTLTTRRRSGVITIRAVSKARPAYCYGHSMARAALLASHPPCYWCGAPNATIADHDPPLALVPVGQRWAGVLRASCTKCSERQGGQLGRNGGIRKRAARGEAPPSRPW